MIRAALTALLIGLAGGAWLDWHFHLVAELRIKLGLAQQETTHARETIKITGELAALPPLADAGTVGDRLRVGTDDSGRVPEPVPCVPGTAADPGPRPPPARASCPAQDPQLAADLLTAGECLRLYPALRRDWKANEAR